MPARTEPVIETICGVGCSTSARPVSRSPVTTLSTPGGRNSWHSSPSSTVDAGVVSRRLEHDACCRRRAPARSSRSPSSAGSSTASPGRRRRSARGGSYDVWSAMYSPADRPSSTRAAPAKNRTWSMRRRQLLARWSARAACRCSSLSTCDELVGPLLHRVGDLEQRRCRSAGVVSPQASNAGAAAAYAAVDVLGPGHRRLGVDLAGRRVDHVVGLARLRVGSLPLTTFWNVWSAISG